MSKIQAREILAIDKNLIWNMESKVYEVIYEDGVTLKENYKMIIFNRYCWQLFEMFPNTPIVSKCSVASLLEKEYYNSDTHIKLLETIFQHICEVNNLRYFYQKEPLLRKVQFVVNDIFNNIVNRISSYVSTIDATDFIEVVKDPKIEEIHKNIIPIPESVDESYKKIKNYLYTTPNTHNRFIKAYRSKSVNENQANQCIGPRGFITDLDRTVFRQPILNGFIRGMGNLYELIIESRTAAKSLNANNTHIKTSEYASRRIQLLSMPVQYVADVDCGSTEYFSIFITKDNIANLKGKYYYNEDTNTLDYIRGDEEFLLNRIVKIRTALGCKYYDRNRICTTCLGKISENIKENSNLGYTMTSYLMEKITQSILSTKHLTHSAKKATIKLEGNANKYFYINEENDIFFREDLDTSKIKIVLSVNKLSRLIDVLNTSSKNIALSKIGELDMITVINENSVPVVTEDVYIGYNARNSIITQSFLNYLKEVPFEFSNKGEIIVDMSKFNKEEPIFHNPMKETDLIIFLNNITSIIETTNKLKVTNPYERLDMLFNAVTEKFKCNISVLEVLVYSITVYNKQNEDYRLGRNSPQPQCVKASNLAKYRSLGQLLPFQAQNEALLQQPHVLFSGKNKEKHPMDVLFLPKEVIEHSKS